MNVVIAEEAEADLERIGDFIARENPARAASFVEELLARCERLADAPHGFPLVPRYEHQGVRRRVHGAYLIFYRIDEEASSIEVLHILHGAQDIDAILFPVG